jgi:hypothetical protein
MPVKAKKQSKLMYQIIGLVVVLFILISVSTVATLMLTGTVAIPTGKASPISYIVDAEKVCVRRVRADHGAAVNAVVVDDRSSTFDESSGLYKLFYDLTLYRDGDPNAGVSTFYVNCFVSSSQGNVSRIEYLEKLDFKPKPVRRKTGNAFGF